jgi:hypothetical protein
VEAVSAVDVSSLMGQLLCATRPATENVNCSGRATWSEGHQVYVDHRFPLPRASRPANPARRLWLVVIVAAITIGLFVAHSVGVDSHRLEVASTMASASVIACSFFERLRLEKRNRARRSAARRPAPIFGQGSHSHRLPLARGAGGLRSLR